MKEIINENSIQIIDLLCKLGIIDKAEVNAFVFSIVIGKLEALEAKMDEIIGIC